MLIEIKKSNKLTHSDHSGFVSFEFDWDIVNKIRSLQTKWYHKNEKLWEVSLEDVKELEKAFPKLKIIDNSNVLKEEIKQTDIKPVKVKNFNFKTKPYAHQKEAFNYGFKKDKWLLADEMGLGKSKVAIDLASAFKETRKYKHCLIICGVNSLKYNWFKEIQTHSNNNAIVLDGSNKERALELSQEPEEYFYIINIEALRNEDVLKEISKLIKNKKINMTVIDEIHKAKNPSSKQGKAIHKLNTPVKMALTGTPLMNNPIDIYNILKWLEVEKHSFYQFKNYYCTMGGFGNYQIVGYKHLNKLSNLLESIMLRRLKKEVLDLPEKIRSIEHIEMGLNQKRIYRDVLKGIKDEIDQIKLNPNPLAMLTRLRQATSSTGIISSTINESAKIDRLKEMVEEITDSGSKLIIYSNWTTVTDILEKEFKEYKPAVITGQVKNRMEQVNKFQDDEECKIMVGTIGAMGTGITLTEANYVIFMDKPWTMASTEQAEDRAHRIGTKSTVNVITLVCKDTVDEKIEDILIEKGDLFDAIVNNKESKIKFIENLIKDI